MSDDKEPPGPRDRPESLRPVAADPPLSAFVQRPNIAMIAVLLLSLFGVLASVAYLLRPVPVGHPDVGAAALGHDGRAAVATQQAMARCGQETPVDGGWVDITATPDGKVVNVVTTGTFASEERRQCVIEDLRTMTLPPFEGPTRTLRAPLTPPLPY